MLTRQEMQSFIERANVRNALNERSKLLNPAEFASEMESYLGSYFSVPLNSGETGIDEAMCPEEHSAYTKAREVFLLENPQFRRGINRFSDIDEAALAWCLASYNEGVRVGAAFEHARREVLGDFTLCRACRGTGITKSYETHNADVVGGPTVCSECHGHGTVSPHF